MSKLKTGIIKLLEEKGIFEADVDYILISEMLFNVKIMQMAKKDITKNGIEKNVSGKGKEPYFQKNSAIVTYNDALKNYNRIAEKLGLSPQDRARLKITEVEQDNDDYGNEFEI